MEYIQTENIIEGISHTQQKEDIVKELEESLQIDSHLSNLRNYVEKKRSLREEKKPLFAKILEIKERIVGLDSSIEVEVMMEYPPRKGSEKQREMLRMKLRNESEEYSNYQKELRECEERLEDISYESDLLEEEVKNSRRVVELHTSYMGVVSSY